MFRWLRSALTLCEGGVAGDGCAFVEKARVHGAEAASASASDFDEDVEVEELHAKGSIRELVGPLENFVRSVAHAADAEVFNGRIEFGFDHLPDGRDDVIGAGHVESGEVKFQPEVFGREGLESGAAGFAELFSRDWGKEAFFQAGGFLVDVGAEDGVVAVVAASDKGVAAEVIFGGEIEPGEHAHVAAEHDGCI